MKGSYVLIIENPEMREIRVGARGPLRFPPGHYAYVGSAMKTLKGRIRRHLGTGKKLHWHVDYLLNECDIRNVFIKPSPEKQECIAAALFLKAFNRINGFGSSDCNCPSHLFYAEKEGLLVEFVLSLGYERYDL